MNSNRNKNLRKLSSREDSREFSQQSVISAMDRFVQAVDNMNETVMVPSRLMDMPTSQPTIAPSAGAPDLYGFYTMLNSVKTQLIWGPGGANLNNNLVNNSKASVTSSPHDTRTSPVSSPFPSQPPSRRLSTVSSLSLSDSDAESVCSDNSEGGATDSATSSSSHEQSSRIAGNFRHHLVGLYHVLQQLTDTADVLTCRYQQEVESSAS